MFEVVVVLVVQLLGIAAHVGVSKRAQKDTDRRLDGLEGDTKDHEGRISFIEGSCPAVRGATH